MTDEPAFPYLSKETRASALQAQRIPCEIQYNGLTKREWFAGMAMMGFVQLLEDCKEYKPADLAKAAFELSDAMLAEGDKPNE